MGSTRSNFRPPDILGFSHNLAMTNIATDTQSISADLRASEDAVKPVLTPDTPKPLVTSLKYATLAMDFASTRPL
jgi:hypothetical protein